MDVVLIIEVIFSTDATSLTGWTLLIFVVVVILLEKYSVVGCWIIWEFGTVFTVL